MMLEEDEKDSERTHIGEVLEASPHLSIWQRIRLMFNINGFSRLKEEIDMKEVVFEYVC
jgi:hypothetical protein